MIFEILFTLIPVLFICSLLVLRMRRKVSLGGHISNGGGGSGVATGASRAPSPFLSPQMTAAELTNHIFPRFEEDEDSSVLEGQVHEVEEMNSWLVTTFPPHKQEEIKVIELNGGLDFTGIILENVLTREECLSIIENTEKLKYGKLGQGKTGQAYRGNRRVQVDDTNQLFTKQLWQRIEPIISKYSNNDKGLPDDDGDDSSRWKCDGLNSRYRFAKYSKGEGFAVHKDKPTIYEQDICSFYTVNIYLNDLNRDQGGETRFFEKMQSKSKLCSAGGLAGSMVIFKQSQFPNSAPHDGELLKYGVKYLMRTDVIFKRVI
jgi:hypothetical protein